MKQPIVTIEVDNKEVDTNIFYQGNIVVNKYNKKMTVLVTYAKDVNWFQGAVLSSEYNSYVGKYDVDWSKDNFVQFVGKITVEI